MSDQPRSWGDLNKQPQPVVDDEFAILCAQVFTAPSGKALLAALRKRYFDNPGNPLAEERALRVRATQQHFIRELELACERGLNASAKKKSP